jgi:hypothetical protein
MVPMALISVHTCDARWFCSFSCWWVPRRGRLRRTRPAPISSSWSLGASKDRAIFAGAQAALERAAKVDARSAEVRAELGAFHLRRSQPEEAETAAKAALAIDGASLEAHRVLGLVYAGYADGTARRRPRAASRSRSISRTPSPISNRRRPRRWRATS